MKHPQPRQTTVEKYTEGLKDLVSDIVGLGTVFSAKEFCKLYNLPNNFVSVCEKLKYISSTGYTRNKRYYPEIVKIDPYHGRKIAETILSYNVLHSTQYEEKVNSALQKSTNVVFDLREIEASNKLSQFSDKELFDELMSRGYKGTLTKEIKLSI